MEIRVRFSKEMREGGWSWTTAWEGSAPAFVGTPRFEVGKQYVLCLGDDNGPAHARGVVGFWQGAFAVVDGARLRPFTHGAPAIDVDTATLHNRLTVRP